jgi:hypothetical protein
MSKACTTVSGSSLVVLVKEENEFGVPEDSGFQKIYVKSNSLNGTQNDISSELLTGGRSATKAGKGNKELGGTLEVAVDNNQFGFWLKQVLGNYSKSTAGSKTSHNFKVSDICLPSFQSEKALLGSNVNYKAVGLRANSLGIEFGGEGELIGSIDVIGKDEFMSPVKADSVQVLFSADYAINTKNITLNDATSLTAGDVLNVATEQGLIETLATKGSSVIEVGLGEGVNFVKDDYITLDNTVNNVYVVSAVAGDLIYLSKSLEEDVTTATPVMNVNNAYMVESVNGNDIVLVSGLKSAVVALTDNAYGETAAVVSNGETFQAFKVDITSATGEVLIGAIQTLNFNFSNNSEGKVLLKDKGTVGRIIDGTTEITCELNILFSADSAYFIESAKKW